jgi:predicted TIM-barrel fold metal-dependent hydrolase
MTASVVGSEWAGILPTAIAADARALLVACCLAAGASTPLPAQESGMGAQAATWRADHHMHVASPDICARLGDCVEDHDPAVVSADDAIAALDAASIARGVVFSSAYLYGLPALGLDSREIAQRVRQENEFTAAEVTRAGGRLVGFLSIDPLSPSAIAELEAWRDSELLVGLKLHFTASAVDLHDSDHRARLVAVFETAAAQGLPIAVHIGGGDFGPLEAQIFIESVLPHAGNSIVQVAHAGGGYPFRLSHHADILNLFAERIAADDPRARRVMFDLSYVPAPEEGPDTVAALKQAMRRIGVERFLFGSDYNVLSPAAQLAALERLQLTEDEMRILRGNCADWVCTE